MASVDQLMGSIRLWRLWLSRQVLRHQEHPHYAAVPDESEFWVGWQPAAEVCYFGYLFEARHLGELHHQRVTLKAFFHFDELLLNWSFLDEPFRDKPHASQDSEHPT